MSAFLCLSFPPDIICWLFRPCSFYLSVSSLLPVTLPPQQVHTLNEQEWEKAEQANVLANIAQAFESETSSPAGDDSSDIFSAVDMLSPQGQTDAQTLAVMLQEQLDAINNEIKLVSRSQSFTLGN